MFEGFRTQGRIGTIQEGEIHRRLDTQPHKIMQKLTVVDQDNRIAIGLALQKKDQQGPQQLLRCISVSAFVG